MNSASDTFYKNRKVWIIGATSGIGYALAKVLSQRGAQVVASGRRVDALAELSEDTESQIQLLPLDVTEKNCLKQAVSEFVESGSLPNTVIYMAAYYEPGPVHNMSKSNLEQTLSVNLNAVLELTRRVLPEFYKRGTGQVAITASVAGYSGLPNGQPYSATKAALINFSESLYTEAAEQGVDVKLINPGFVETPMTDKNSFTMPNILTPEEAAENIADGLTGRNFEIHFPRRFTLKLKFLRLLPYWLFFRLMKNI